MMPIKIGIINDQNAFNGTSSYAFNMYENLSSHGYMTTFSQFSIEEQSKHIPYGATINKGFLFNLKSNKKIVYDGKLALNFLTGNNWRHFKQLKSDIQILSGPTLLPLTKIFPKNIVIGHDLYFLEYNKNTIEGIYMKRLYKMFNRAKTIIVNSNYTKEQFHQKLKIDENKIFTVYPYINRNIFFPGKSNIRNLTGVMPDDKVILSVGGDNSNKNILTIIKVLNCLPKNYKLIRVGKSDHSARIAKKLNLERRIVNVGNVQSTVLSDLYRRSDVFIFPSHSEGFGLPIIEAMASGTPIVSSNKGSLPEVVCDSGITCDPLDVNCLADAVKRITMDENFKNELVKKGLARINIFSKEFQFKTMNNVIEEQFLL